MLENNLLEGRTGPITQSIRCCKSLLACVGRASDPLPADVILRQWPFGAGVEQQKRCILHVTAKTCSCPSASISSRTTCKHQRKYFPQSEAAQTKPRASEPLIKRGGFKPFDELPSERGRPKPPLFLLSIVTTPRSRMWLITQFAKIRLCGRWRPEDGHSNN